MSKNKFSPKLRKLVYDKSDGLCWYCGIQTIANINHTLQRASFAIDHIDNKGSKSIHNLVPCCRGCNTTKKNRSLEEFRILLSVKYCGYIRFSNSQIAFLNRNNIRLPKQELYQFWYEHV